MVTLLDAVGAHLETAGEQTSIVVVGGAALALRGWVSRTTRDVDAIALADQAGSLLPPRLSDALLAVRRVARDFNLPEHWLNAAVGAQWRAGLPDGLAADLAWHSYRALRGGLAGRQALIALKMFAAADKGPASVHTQDLVAGRSLRTGLRRSPPPRRRVAAPTGRAGPARARRRHPVTHSRSASGTGPR